MSVQDVQNPDNTGGEAGGGAARPTEYDLRIREVVAREREVAAREREVASKVRAARRAGLPALALVAVAGIGGWFGLRTERMRFESSLMIEAAKTGSAEKAAAFLRPFVESGYLDEARLAPLLDEPSKLPVFPDGSRSSVIGDAVPMADLAFSYTGAGGEVVNLGKLGLLGREVGTVRLPDGGSVKLEAELVDATARRVRVIGRFVGDRTLIDTVEGRAGDSLTFSAAPPLGRVTVTILHVEPQASPLAAPQGAQP